MFLASQGWRIRKHGKLVMTESAGFDLDNHVRVIMNKGKIKFGIAKSDFTLDIRSVVKLGNVVVF